MKHFGTLIVGGGHGGAQAAIALRQHKFDGSIAIIGEEPDFPYERPPLSKDYFSGEKSFERILIRPPHFWEERDITMILGERVTAIDPIARQVTTASGEAFGYDKLIWATGGRPRALAVPGGDLEGVQPVRTRADADRLKEACSKAQRIVVIGGGYIGLESAAVLAKGGKSVVLVEALPRLLARVAGEDLSEFFAGRHREHGVEIRFAAAVEAIEGDERVRAVRLSDGSVIPADHVIVGIGIVPAVEPLIEAGAAGDNGVAVDAMCRTTLPDVYAIGDCAAHRSAFADWQSIRLESVQNANDMAATAARSICGEDKPYHAVPWFWSNQYDLKLQTVGLSQGHDDAVLRGDPACGSFSVVYLKHGRVIALDCVNNVKDYVQGRKLIESGAPASREAIADAARPLKELAP